MQYRKCIISRLISTFLSFFCPIIVSESDHKKLQFDEKKRIKKRKVKSASLVESFYGIVFPSKCAVKVWLYWKVLLFFFLPNSEAMMHIVSFFNQKYAIKYFPWNSRQRRLKLISSLLMTNWIQYCFYGNRSHFQNSFCIKLLYIITPLFSSNYFWLKYYPLCNSEAVMLFRLLFFVKAAPLILFKWLLVCDSWAL